MAIKKKPVTKTSATKAPVTKTKGKTAVQEKPVVKSKKTESAAPVKMTPAERMKKMQAARAAAKASGKAPVRNKAAAAKRKLLSFAAPADFKSHFLLVEFRTEKDGLIGIATKATRYMGRFDFKADEKKKFNLGEYDPATLRGIIARLSAITYKATQDRFYSIVPKERIGVKGSHRMPKGAHFAVLMRVGYKKADNTLTARVSQCYQAVEKNGKKTMAILDKADPVNRLLRRSSRLLPAVFQNVQMPPKKTRTRKTEEE